MQIHVPQKYKTYNLEWHIHPVYEVNDKGESKEEYLDIFFKLRKQKNAEASDFHAH